MEASRLKKVQLRSGNEFHYLEEGEGQPLVFVHGGFGDWRSWEPQWPAFSGKFRCITYSRRYSVPNANSPATKYHAVHDEAADLEELLSTWCSEPAILVGTSYGAYTALALALKSPQAILAMAIAEPPLMHLADRLAGGRQVRRQFELEVLLPAGAAFKTGNTERAVTLLVNGINGLSPNFATSEVGLARRFENARAMHFLLACDDPFPRLDEERLRALTVPTLLLAGERTEPIHDVIFRALTRVMTQASQARIPNCGHGAHRDNPGAFNELVLSFVTGIDRRGHRVRSSASA